ncbi:hypothetical protein EC973_007603 [Apophysomyces ossiformis]|uniref:[histone H3]-trimethyl-L-lysine(4) demethylase n=1 Tax=Apophysomyces ossiformis TaxID=679940 RepID=A0A8H7BPF7_9FUNG|nr:hypothetical protein EC973_007603 [Apophysomyces ossiformis]
MFTIIHSRLLQHIPVLATRIRYSTTVSRVRNSTVRIPDLKDVTSSSPSITDLNRAVDILLSLVRQHNGRVLVLTGAAIAELKHGRFALGISTDSGGVYVRNPTHRPIFYHELISSDLYRRRYWARGFLGWPSMSRAQPNGTHHTLAWLLAHQYIGHIITQNVDNLHFVAGTSREHVLELHGTLRRVECLECGATADREQYQHRLNARNPAWVAYQRSLNNKPPKVNPDGDVDLPGDVSYEDFDIPPCHICSSTRIKPQVVFFGQNIDPAITILADNLVKQFEAVLVIGSSLATYSSFRLVRLAETLGKPVAILNLGPTRADALASWKIELGCTTVLEQVRTRLDGSTTKSGADELLASFDLSTVNRSSDVPKRTRPRIFGLTEAPTYYPSAEDFVDPIAYIQKIRPEAEQYGIIKIVPPSTYKPDFCLNTKAFRFRTRIQKLNSMEGETRANVNYLGQLYKYHRLSGHPVNKIPQLDKRPIDLYKLKKEVALRGGYQVVTQQKKWAEIGRMLGYTRKQCTSMSNALKSAYQRVILPYEIWYAQHKDQNPSKMTPSIKPQESDDSNNTSNSSQACEICHNSDNEEEILLCDGCDRGYHMNCLTPPLTAVPKTDWFCVKCLTASGEDYGFEDGEEYSLQSFQQVCDKFKKEWFSKNKKSEETQQINEEDCEDEFWRLVENPHETCEVEYGADLHSTQHGSGFSAVHRQGANGLPEDPWNLNNIPVLPRSLFQHIKADISGMMVPWLYVGMCFSAFCWHNEDHYTYSVNYMHWGETKTWYGVPGDDTSKFEDTMKKAVPELFEQQPDLLFQLVTMLSPGRLLKENVRVYAVDQRPGQFVVTFPKAYHSGFNHGFNFCEAVNFAPLEWLNYGLECVKRYKEYRRQPCFSHDELLVTTALNDRSPETAEWLKDALLDMQQREMADREKLRKQYPKLQQTTAKEHRSDDGPQCVYCNSYAYLSHISCECTDKVACLDHFSELCSCDVSKKSCCVRYSDQQLHELAQVTLNTASTSAVWNDKVNRIMSGRPTVKVLRQLLSEGEKISPSLEQVQRLRDFIEQITLWSEDVNKHLIRKHQHRRRDAKENEQKSAKEYQGKRYERILELLDQASSWSFDAPEIKLLRETATLLTDFKDRASLILKNPKATITEFKDVYELGLSLGADTEEMRLLEMMIKQQEWLMDAPAAIQNPLTYEQVVQLVDEAEACEISPTNDVYQKLVEKKHIGSAWVSQAKAVLQKDSPTTIDALRKVVHVDPDTAISLELVNRVRDLLHRATDVMENTAAIINQCQKEQFSERPSIGELHRIMKSIKALHIPMHNTVILEREANNLDAWHHKTKKLFVSSRSISHKSLETVLEEVLENVRTITTITEPTNPISVSDVYCLCRTPESGLMIECDMCHEWYHGPCVKVTRREAKSQSSYICPICNGAQNIPHSTKQPKLEDILASLAHVETMWFIPVEYEALKEIACRMQTFQIRVQAFCRSKTQLGIEDVDMIRMHLRELEGLEVLLPDETEFLRKKMQTLAPPPSLLSQQQATEQQTVYCLCRREYNPKDPEMPMILCDTCNEWFHIDCVDLPQSVLETIDKYKCPNCTRRSRPAEASPRRVITKNPERPAQQPRAHTIIKLTVKPPAPPTPGPKRKSQPMLDGLSRGKKPKSQVMDGHNNGNNTQKRKRSLMDDLSTVNFGSTNKYNP